MLERESQGLLRQVERLLAHFSGRRWGMELKIEDLLLEKISVVIE